MKLATLGSLALLLVSAAAGAADCNRDCLKRHLDPDLTAVTRPKAGTGNFGAGFRQTENAVRIPHGEGPERRAGGRTAAAWVGCSVAIWIRCRARRVTSVPCTWAMKKPSWPSASRCSGIR